MKTYFDAWISVASALFPQALAGEPEFNESLPKPMAEGAFGFAATIEGDQTGRFIVLLDPALLNTSLVGDGIDQKAGWAEILREVADAAAGELLARTGAQCKVAAFEEIFELAQISQAFQLRTKERTWSVVVRDEVKAAIDVTAKPSGASEAESKTAPATSHSASTLSSAIPAGAPAGENPGTELLLDVELEASLRFGCREIHLGQLLDLGPGDVVELDRHISDPVDLIVGDKILARGEVVLVNGDFGLRVTEVAVPRKRLESIRCLF
ncbi:MAG TPA: FliM/FliN family flagellar motor switch protein [Terracidiphilus sp.]|nr:FliM/FliN family flagellar motor switch protein [Terracidiphilus sp.]